MNRPSLDSLPDVDCDESEGRILPDAFDAPCARGCGRLTLSLESDLCPECEVES